MWCCSSAWGNWKSSSGYERPWLAHRITGRCAELQGCGIRENWDVSHPIESQKMNLKKPGYQLKQWTEALEAWKEKSPMCCLYLCGSWYLRNSEHLCQPGINSLKPLSSNSFCIWNAKCCSRPSEAGTKLEWQPCVSWSGIPTNSPDPSTSPGSFSH